MQNHEMEELEIVDLNLLEEGSMCSCSSGDDNPH